MPPKTTRAKDSTTKKSRAAEGKAAPAARPSRSAATRANVSSPVEAGVAQAPAEEFDIEAISDGEEPDRRFVRGPNPLCARIIEYRVSCLARGTQPPSDTTSRAYKDDDLRFFFKKVDCPVRPDWKVEDADRWAQEEKAPYTICKVCE